MMVSMKAQPFPVGLFLVCRIDQAFFRGLTFTRTCHYFFCSGLFLRCCFFLTAAAFFFSAAFGSSASSVLPSSWRRPFSSRIAALPGFRCCLLSSGLLLRYCLLSSGLQYSEPQPSWLRSSRPDAFFLTAINSPPVEQTIDHGLSINNENKILVCQQVYRRLHSGFSKFLLFLFSSQPTLSRYIAGRFEFSVYKSSCIYSAHTECSKTASRAKACVLNRSCVRSIV